MRKNFAKSTSRTLRRRALVVVLSLVLITSSVQIWGYLFPRDASADWYDESYTYRQPITFTHNAAISGSRKVTFTLDTAELITEGVMQSDCDDTRFTDPNGYAYDFELTGTCNNATTTYEVVYPLTINGSNLAYVYYGNPSAVNAEIDTSSITALTPSGGDPSITDRTNEEKGPGPILWFKFDEGADNTCPDGADVCDSTAGGNNGTVGAGIVTGDGHDSALTSSFSSFEYEAINAISGSGQANADRIEVASTANITAGDDVLVIQMSGTGQGAWETCDVAAIQTNDYVDCEADLANTYQSSGAQLVVMPQWTDVTIGSSESITTSAWDGTIGGIIAFRASGLVTIESGGSIDADEIGFSGGTTTTGGVGGTGGVPASGLGTDGGAANAGSAGTGPGAGNGGAAGGDFGSGPTSTGGRGGGGAAGGSGGGAGGSYGTAGSAGSAGTGSGFNGGAGGSTGGGVGGTGSNGSAGSVGSTYGAASLSSIFLGSGGGAGGSGAGGGGGGSGLADAGTNGGAGGTGGSGGAGGGIIFVQANAITVDGAISNNGANGGNGANGNQGVDSGNANQGHGGGGAPGAGGGGGAGGSIYLSGNTVDIGSSLVTAGGGSGGNKGSLAGDGGDGNRTGGTGNSNGGGGGSSQATFGGEPTATSGQGPGNGSIGGSGRIHIDYTTSLSGTATPTADEASIGDVGNWRGPELCFNDKCLFYDGSNDVVTVQNSTEIDLNAELSDEFTIQSWIRVNSDGENNTGQIFSKGTNTYLRITNEGSDGLADLEASIDLASTNATLSLTDAITLNKWHLVTLLYEDDADDEITIYIDGVSQGSSSNGSGSLAAESNQLLIGGSESNNFHGFIDEFKIYPYTRTANQILTDMPSHSPSSGASASFGSNDSFLSHGLAGYWNMDESSGTITDSSGNNYTLTNNNTVAFVAGKYGKGSEFVPASSEYFSTATQINGIESISFWTNPDSNTNYYVSLTSGAYITSTSGTLSTTGLTNSRIFVNGTETSTVTANNWQHILVTFDSIDANQFYLGRQGSNYYDGTLDDVRIYNRKLPNDEIKLLSNWAPGPIGYWNFNENTGTSTAYDRSGNANNGVLTGSMTETDWVQGKYGSGLDLDGSDDRVVIADPGTDSIFDTDLHVTLEAWVSPHSVSGYQTYIVKGSTAGTDNATYILGQNDNKISFCFYHVSPSSGYSCWSSTAVLTTNTWQHVSVSYTYGSSAIDAYINATPLSSGTWDSGTGTETPLVSNDPLWIGATNYPGGSATEEVYDGVIDEVQIYNYERSQGQIVKDMNAYHPLGGSPVGSKILHWKFDELNGTSTYNSGFYTGSEVETGTLQGSPGWKTENDCKIGGCLEFSGADDQLVQIDESDSLYLAFENEPFTISAWAFSTSMPGASDEEGIVSMWDQRAGQDHRHYRMYLENDDSDTTGNFSVQLYDETNNQAITASGSNDFVQEDTWYHVALTYNGATGGNAGDLKIYINGILAGSNTANGSFSQLQTEAFGYFGVGGYNTVDNTATFQEFTGRIDDVKVYTTELTDYQIKIDMNAGSTASLGGVSSNSEASTLTDGAGNPPVAHWAFDENTGTSTLIDKSGNNYNGTMTSISESDWIPGKIGSALNFDGSTNSVDIVASNTLLPSNDLWSIGGWFKLNTVSISTDTRFFAARRGATGSAFFFALDDDTTDHLQFTYYDGVGFQDIEVENLSTLGTTVWHHISATYDGTTFNVYLDGILSQSVIDTDFSGFGSGVAAFGYNADASNQYYDGQLDEFKIYSYVRTPAQIAYDYSRGAPVGWWRLDECQGTTANDVSSNGNTGTITIGGSGTATAVGTCETSGAWANGISGKFSASLGLDGADDEITIPDTELHRFDSNTQDYSFFSWIKRAGSGTEYIVSKEDADNDGWRLHFESGNTLTCSLNSTDITSTLTITDTNWHHVGCVVDRSSSIRVYIDGNLAASGATSSDTMATTADIHIGTRAYTSTNYFEGLIDDIRIYNYALSSAQVKNVMNYGAVRFAE